MSSSSSRTTIATRRRVRRVRLGRHARARRPADYPTLGAVIDRTLARDGRGLAAFHRSRSSRAAQPLDPQAHLSRRVSADAREVFEHIVEPAVAVRARRREPAPALCQDARALASGGSTTHPIACREDVRRDVRAGLAAVPRGLAGRVHHRVDAAVSGGVRARRQQRDSLDARSG